MTKTTLEKASILNEKIEALDEIIQTLIYGGDIGYTRYALYGDPGDGVTDYICDIEKEGVETLRNFYINRRNELVKEFEEL